MYIRKAPGKAVSVFFFFNRGAAMRLSCNSRSVAMGLSRNSRSVGPGGISRRSAARLDRRNSLVYQEWMKILLT